jgi:hypothetical protein
VDRWLVRLDRTYELPRLLDDPEVRREAQGLSDSPWAAAICEEIYSGSQPSR